MHFHYYIQVLEKLQYLIQNDTDAKLNNPKKALETLVFKPYQNGETLVNTPDIQPREKET